MDGFLSEKKIHGVSLDILPQILVAQGFKVSLILADLNPSKDPIMLPALNLLQTNGKVIYDWLVLYLEGKNCITQLQCGFKKFIIPQTL